LAKIQMASVFQIRSRTYFVQV